MPTPYDNAPSNVRAALDEAARVTGVDHDLLVKITARESQFNPYAANPKSSAKGLGQFLDGSWEAITKTAGSKYGINVNTSRFDPRASALMTAEQVKVNRSALRQSLGREASPGELYSAHFMGAGGAADLINATTKNPSAAAADLFPKEAASNPNVFYEKGTNRKRTTTEVLRDLTATAGGDVTSGLGTASANIYGAEPLPPVKPFLERLTHGYVAAAEQEQTQVMATQYALRMGDESLAPDAKFRWTPDKIKALTGALPEHYAEWVVDNAHSDAHAADLVKRAQHEMDNEGELAGYGLMGNLGLRGAAILTDVPTWLIGAGAGKIAGFTRLGKLAIAGRAGLLAAAENAPAELLKHAERADYGLDDMALGTTTALAFGAGFGAIFGHSGGELDAVFQKEAAHTERAVLDDSGVKLSAEGEAAYERGAGPRVAASGGAAAAPVTKALPLGETLGRVDLFGKLIARANQDIRDLMPKLFTDPVGDGGKTVRGAQESAWDFKVRTEQTIKAKVTRTTDDAFKEWADARGLGLIGRIKERTAFNEEVGRALYSAADPEPGPIARAVAAHQEAYAKVLAEAKTSGAAWAENVKPNERYFPMVFDKNRVRELVSRFDEDGVASVISQALRAVNSNLTAELADKTAQKYLRTVQSVTEGVNSNMVHVINGQDREGLKQLLIEQGLSSDEAGTVVDVLKPSTKTGPSNFRQKTLMADQVKYVPKGASVKVSKSDAFSVRDLTVLDADKVLDRYVQQMSGQIAMVRAGFQNAGAFESHAMSITKGRQNTALTRDAKGKVTNHYPDSHADADLSALRYLGKTLYGVPTHEVSPVLQRLASIFGNWNFTRFMGQSGIAQLADVPKIMLKNSFSSAFQTFRLGDIAQVFRKGGHEADEMARGLEELTGVGTIGARGKLVNHFEDIDEFYPEDTAHVALDRAAKVTKTGANITAMVSGMVPVTDFLGRWATRASMQHLADIVRGVKAKPQNVLNDMGLGPAELARFKTLVGHMDISPNGVVRKLNLEKLQKIDPEGVDKLGAWLSRSARQTVLEPNPAQLPQWMGHPLARLLMQFRTFSMASHAANTMHNLKMGYAYAGQSLLLTSTWAGLIYAGQTYMRSIGKPDREEYLETAFKPLNWAASAFNKSADSGLIPMLADTALDPAYAATGWDSPFANGRTTGLAAGITGTPIIAGAVDLQKSFREVFADSFRDDKRFTRTDMQRWSRILPLNNTYGVANALAAFSGLFPKDEDGED